jgi:hypothetical protein
MLLLRPSPGVCIDRQVILRLKIDEAMKRSVGSRHFAEEHQALQVYLEKHWFPSIKRNQRKEFDLYSCELSKVNRALWGLEDEIRRLRSLPQSGRKRETKRIVSIAFAIPQLNDDRARVVEKINAPFQCDRSRKAVFDHGKAGRAKEPASAH